MNEQIVALSIDKVQTCLFEVIHAHEQEKQTEGATLKSIMNSSHEISKGFFDTVQRVFSKEGILLACSGVYIFRCALSEEDIAQRLNRLFLEYYHSSQGQKLLRYVYFPADGYDEIGAIQKAKKRLKQSSSFNNIIEKNREQLFSFCEIKKAEEKPDDSCEKERETSAGQSHPMFADHLNALFHEGDSEKAENKNRFRIAVIKADLDGMGDLFKQISDYEKYQRISRALNETIALDALHRAAEACRPEGREGWLFPFYIAGDDIFFAVSVANLIKGVEVCLYLLKNITGAIQSYSQQQLSVSIGVEVTINRQPIRYYLEMVEEQLKYAKKAQCPEILKPFLKAKIAIGGLAFFDLDYDKFKEHKKKFNKKDNREKKELEKLNQEINSVPVWRFFLNDLSLLRDIQKEEKYKKILATPSFFYALLERLSRKDAQNDGKTYINQLLYQLLPKYLGSSDPKLWKMELLLNAGILGQLYQKGPKGCEIKCCDNTKRRLEIHLRLMLLFSDTRFNMSRNVESNNNLLDGDRITDAGKLVLKKSRNYLFEQMLPKSLRDFFVKLQPHPHPKYKKVKYFQRLRLHKSLFFKLRDTQISIDKAAAMVALNAKAVDRGNNANGTTEGNTKPVYRMDFDEAGFRKAAAKEGSGWTPDFVDSLMLFYQYSELMLKYPAVYTKKKAPQKQKGVSYHAKHN
jgi:hypothetical protein